MGRKREIQKLQTQQSLTNAALELIGRGQNFSTISLREVAKIAGIVPTGFYRHFQSMEELGLSLVDQASCAMRRLSRDIIKNYSRSDCLVDQYAILYAGFVQKHISLFYFLEQSRSGGTAKMRLAIRNEHQYFIQGLKINLQNLDVCSKLTPQRAEHIANMWSIFLTHFTMEIINIDCTHQRLDDIVTSMVECMNSVFLQEILSESKRSVR